MLLRKLIKNLPKKISQINILGLASNSKKVKKGFIFFAIDGHNANGEKYIKEAIKNGAVVIVCSEKSKIKDIFIDPSYYMADTNRDNNAYFNKP